MNDVEVRWSSCTQTKSMQESDGEKARKTSAGESPASGSKVRRKGREETGGGHGGVREGSKLSISLSQLRTMDPMRALFLSLSLPPSVMLQLGLGGK